MRETAIVGLGAPTLGFEVAVAFALLTRLLHVAVDGAMIAGVALFYRRPPNR